MLLSISLSASLTFVSLSGTGSWYAEGNERWTILCEDSEVGAGSDLSWFLALLLRLSGRATDSVEAADFALFSLSERSRLPPVFLFKTKWYLC